MCVCVVWGNLNIEFNILRVMISNTLFYLFPSFKSKNYLSACFPFHPSFGAENATRIER
jgi:hypothetical protein